MRGTLRPPATFAWRFARPQMAVHRALRATHAHNDTALDIARSRAHRLSPRMNTRPPTHSVSR
jgi:hypothetical protein